MKKLAKVLCVVLSVVLVGSVFAACGNKEIVVPTAKLGEKQATYNTYTVTVPSLWNELDSMDENNQQIMQYLSSSFFEFDYLFDGGKFKADGSVNADGIVDGKFDVKYSAATALEDVTSTVDAKWGYTADQKKVGGYAWKITLRDDLKWNDGTAIKAADFVYSMKEQLNPQYMYRRASSYYGAVSVKGAKNYVYQGQKSWYAASTAYDLGEYTTDLDDKLVFSLGSGEENAARGKAISYVRNWFNGRYSSDVSGVGYEVVARNINGLLGVDLTGDQIAALEGKTLAAIKADATLNATWETLLGAWKTDPGEEMHFMITEYEWPEFDFANVGLYSPSEYEIVICYTTSEKLKKDDGSLSYQAAYTLANLPLVKKDLYESCSKAPTEGSTLYTSTYNTSLETTASWGPYMLTQYQSGKSYTLEKNPNWYGYKLDDNKDQYNINKIVCEALAQSETQWMAFLSGKVDSIGIDVTHAADYRNSKYAYFTAGTYTFSWHLFSDLDVLKTSGRNNGILAIQDFRKALSLAIDREDYAAKNTTAYKGGYGYLNSMYYYDVENGGIYRDTVQGKEALLRAYGYTQEADGTWSLSSSATIKNFSLDDAYATLKGYDLTLAKEYLEKAYKELTDNAEKYGYDASKNIEIKFGTSEDNDTMRREFNHVQEQVIDKLTAGTSLEGKVKVVFDASFGDNWDKAFAAGQYELCTSAWGSAAFDPFYFIGAYIDPDNAYTASYFDTESEQMTFKMPGTAGEFPGAGEELTMTLMNWYRCLNGYEFDPADVYTYDWSEGHIKAEYRLAVLAALEEYMLTQYFSIPTITQFSATLLGAKFSYISDEYNTFMGYGGMRYMIVNCTDDEWNSIAAGAKNGLSELYKKTA